MNIDNQLHADAQAWRLECASASDVDDMARRAVNRARRPRRLVTLASVALLLVALGGVLLGVHLAGRGDGGAAADVPASIVVHGRNVPLAGTIPWDSAIIRAGDPLELTVYADGDKLSTLCGLPTERGYAVLRQGHLVITVAGYAKPPEGICGGVGHSPQPVVVPLPPDAPLRAITDPTTGDRHTVLDAGTVPTITAALPKQCRSSGLRWDDTVDKAIRTWQTPTGTPCLVELDYGRRYVAARLDNLEGHALPPTSVHGHPALVALHTDGNNHAWKIKWHAAGGHGISLLINTSPRAPLSEAQALAIARSVR